MNIIWLSSPQHLQITMSIFKTPKNWCVLQLKSQSQFTLATDGFHREISAICSEVHVTLHQPTLHPRSHFFNRVLALRNPCRITWLAPPSKYTINMLNMWKKHRIQLKSYDTDLCCLPSLGPKSHESCPCTMQHLGEGCAVTGWSEAAQSTSAITAEWQM